MNSDELTLLALGIVAIVFLVAMNLWAYWDRRRNNLTLKDQEEEARRDPHIWWP